MKSLRLGFRTTSILALSVLLSGCSFSSKLFAPADRNVDLTQGPPIEDVVTSFDDALTCLRGRIPSGITFAVGQVIDATGKETYADGGTGKFVTQGVGEMVQSALFRAGVSVVNRRDPQISIVEANWGIRDIKRQTPVNFYMSGSVNSLDFIPGGGFSAQIGGIGPRVRQNRMLIALDLSITDAYTGRVVASIPLQKQIYTREIGGSANTFFGTTLLQLDAGGMEREALHFALRQMLNFATFELLGQLMKQSAYDECREKITATDGFLTKMGTADRAAVAHAIRAMKEQGSVNSGNSLAVPVSQPTPAAQSGRAVTQNRQEPAAPVVAEANKSTPQERQAAFLAKKSTLAATDAIRAARESEKSKDRSEAVKKAAEALNLSNIALKLLQKAAEFGFGGDEGEVAAVVVQQAIQSAQRAGTAAAARPMDGEARDHATDAVADPLNEDASGAEDEGEPSVNIAPGGPVLDKRRINE